MQSLNKLIYRSALVAILTFVVIGAISLIYIESTLPSVAKLQDIQLQVPLRIYTSDGKLINEFGQKRRTPVEFSEVPTTLINAILATEDHRFYNHNGVDLFGLARAMVSLIRTGSKDQGASTITMQVARNFFLTRKKTYLRKINEILLALRIEKLLSKEEIFNLYLNKIFFGKHAYGIAAAAEVYYGTTIDKLTLAQMAMIAGIPQSPSKSNPLRNPKAAIKRRKHVLDRLLEYEYISKEHYTDAITAPITAKYHTRTIEVEAPYVAEMVRLYLVEQYGENVYTQGYNIYTTIDSKLQVAANDAVKRTLLEYDQRHGFRQPEARFQFTASTNGTEHDLLVWAARLRKFPNYATLQPTVITSLEPDRAWGLLNNGEFVAIPFKQMQWARKQHDDYGLGPKPKAPTDIVKIGDVVYLQPKGKTWRLSQIPEVSGSLVAIDPDTGEIKALVGGFDYKLSKFNRVIQAERQPGSSFKPFVYTAALQHGFTLASIINDAPIVTANSVDEEMWRPRNHNRRFYGPTRLRVGFTTSRNLVLIRLLQNIGINNTIDTAVKFGFDKSKIPKGLSLALGTVTVTPLQLASSYCIFANGGYKVKPYFINKITDYDREEIFGHIANTEITAPVIESRTNYLVNSLLQRALKKGTGWIGRSIKRNDLAGKTGTTSNYVDGWYAGFNRDLVAVAWVGFDDPRSLKEYGVKSALPMWKYFMDKP